MKQRLIPTIASISVVILSFSAPALYGQALQATKDQLKGTRVIDVSEAGGLAVDYGFAYNSSRRRFLGSPCVTFSSDDVVTETGSPTTTNKFIKTSSYAEIARAMDLSVAASASYGGSRFEASASTKVDVINETQTHRYTQTILAKVEIIAPPEYLDLTSSRVRLKDEYREMLETPGQRGKFRQRCGDSFVIGTQWGHRFYGTGTIDRYSQQTLINATKQGDFEASYGAAQASSTVTNARDYRSDIGDASVSVKTWRTGVEGSNSSDLETLESSYNSYKGGAGKGERLKLIVTSYETLEDFPMRSPLAPRTPEAKLGYLKDALWDLQSMIAEARFVLNGENFGALDDPSNPGRFAYGSTRSARNRNRARVEELHQRWRQEFESLRDVTLHCMTDFTDDCERAASLYWREPERHGSRIRAWREEVAELPTPYAKLCRAERITLEGSSPGGESIAGAFEARGSREFPHYNEFGTPTVVIEEQYDGNPSTPEMDGDLNFKGRPVLARGWLDLNPARENRSLFASLGVHLSEYGQNKRGERKYWSELGGTARVEVFSVDDDAYGGELETCRIAPQRPLRERRVDLRAPSRSDRRKRLHRDMPPGGDGSLLSGSRMAAELGIDDACHGYVRKLIHSPKKYEQYPIGAPRGGILKSMRCLVRTDGRETPKRGKGRLKNPGAFCTTLDINPVVLRLYSVEDESADRQTYTRLQDLEIVRVASNLPGSTPVVTDLAQAIAPTDLLLHVEKEPSEDETDTRTSPSSCAEAVQGKIAWDYSGSTRWAATNVKRLCSGAEDSDQPAQCFDRVMHDGVDWGGGTRWSWRNALNLCRGTRDADGTITCFQQKIARGVSWRKAIPQCQWDRR